MFRRDVKSFRKPKRQRERGVTLLITAVAMIPLLGMAALAIDVVTLYSASGEAQKAADAGALAGAKAFVTTGFTSGQLGDPTQSGNQAFACNGSTGYSDLQATAAAQLNLVAGGAPTTITTSCNFTTAENPSITVTVTKTGLPTFFARIWGAGATTARAVATAEAYNPSGSTTVPIKVQSVKPWLIPNCNPLNAPPCPGGQFFINSTANYALNNPNLGVGNFYTFVQANPKVALVAGTYYALDLPQGRLSCPSTSAAPAGSCSNINLDAYQENIGCANTATLSCGDTVTVDPNTSNAAMRTDTTQGTQCLIHTISHGNGNANLAGSCAPPADNDPDCFVSLAGSLPTINGGASNPNPSMRVANISRSDSVVTVPVFDFQTPIGGADDPCPSGVCGTATVMGFLQLGIQHISASGKIGAVVLNASGCDPASAGNPAVSGGGVSPVPVRLTQ
ncbi:MAG: pilus assembly protein TadG-related protein [Terriglobales bacterium]